MFFSVVLGIAERRRGFEELSLFRVGTWGPLAGVLVGLLTFVPGSTEGDVNLWLLAVWIIAPVSVLRAVSAAGSLAIARMADEPERLHAGARIAEVGKGT